MPTYTFMTGAHRYRCQAATVEDAMAIARKQLNPSPSAEAVIRSTLREELPVVADPAPSTEAAPAPQTKPAAPSLARGPSRSQAPRPPRGRRGTDRVAGG